MNKQRKNISVSVIVPVYNVEQYLTKCLSSLVSQNMPFDEIILVNDGSTDNSKSICEEFGKHYSNIILLNQNNYGQAVARNRGLEYAKGEYVVFVDADDYINNSMNMCIHHYLENDNVDMLFYRQEYLNEMGTEYNDVYFKDEYLGGNIMSGMEFFQKRFQKNYNVVVYLFAFKRTFINEYNILFPKGLYYEDNVFFVHAVLYAKRVKCIPERLYVRRIRPNSTMTGKLTERKGLDYIRIQQLVWEKLYLYPGKCNHKMFFKQFLSNSLIMPFTFLHIIRNSPIIQKSLEEMVICFIDKWFSLYVEEELSWNDIFALQYIIPYIKENRAGHLDAISAIIGEALNEKLGELGLNDSKKKIGIYGIGKAAEQLCKVYEKYIGTISCELFFVMTKKNSDLYKGKQLFSCEEIPGDMDFIIISSLVYGDEMKNELLKKNVELKKIKELYSKDDKVDLSQMKMLTKLNICN